MDPDTYLQSILDSYSIDPLIKSYDNFDLVSEHDIDRYIDKYKYVDQFCILFDTKMFIRNNLKSYISEENIWKELAVDCPRMDIFVINNKIYNIVDFKKYLNRLEDRFVCINGIFHKLNSVLALLCTQSSFAFPFDFLHSALSKPANDIYLADLGKNRYIKIYFNKLEDGLTITFQTDFCLKDLSKNKIVSKLDCVLTLNTLKIDTSIVEFANNGTFYVKFL